MKTIHSYVLIFVVSNCIFFANMANSGVDGTASISSKISLKASKCPRGRGDYSFILSLNGDGSWQIIDEYADIFSGTYSEIKTGRKFSMQFDQNAWSAIWSDFESSVSYLCDTQATITDIYLQKFDVKLNKKQNAVKIKLKINGVGYTYRGSGKGKYKLIGKGNFNLSGL